MQFHISGPFELFKYYIIHTAACIYQRCRHDCQTSTLFNVSRRSEEPFGPLQGIAVHAARQNLSACGNDCVIGACQACNAVEEDDHIAFVFDKSLGFFHYHFCNLDMAGSRFVECGADNLPVYRTLHIGNFLRPLINQKNNQNNLGMVLRNRVGNRLKQHCFARSRRGDDQPALAFPDGRQHIHHSSRKVVRSCFQLQMLVRIQRGQIVEKDFILGRIRVFKIYGFYLDKGEITFPFLGRADLTGNGVPGA